MLDAVLLVHGVARVEDELDRGARRLSEHLDGVFFGDGRFVGQRDLKSKEVSTPSG